MSYAQLFSLSLCATVAGCASEKRATVTARVHGPSAMRSAILDHLPVGTPLAEAKDFMTREGYKCSVERNGEFGNHEGIDYIYLIAKIASICG